MDSQKLIQDRWEDARKSASTTTTISLVLFAALIVSWSGMWGNINKYRIAVASRLWAEKKNAKLEEVNLVTMGEVVRLNLLADAFEYDKKSEQRKRIEKLAELVGRRPYALEILREKKARGGDSSDVKLLERIIPFAESQLRSESRKNLRVYHIHRASAEKAAFKLLGLDFSVDGFWAWIVWLSLLTGGVFQLWLARRTLIRRGRETAKQLSDGSNLSSESVLPDSLPIWARPLKCGEAWVSLLTNSARKDLSLEPLSGLCIALLLVCLGLALPVIWMAAISTSLIRPEHDVDLNTSLHAAALCLVVGIITSLVLSWPTDPSQDVEVVGRRVWILGSLSTIAAAILYLPALKTAQQKLLLRKPRFRLMADMHSRHRRREKFTQSTLKTGFYVDDRRNQIHFLPASQHSRYLARVNQDQVSVWNGPFNAEELPRVHHSALVPFARRGVEEVLRSFRHRHSAERFREAANKPEWRQRHLEAFTLVQRAILADVRTSSRPMPNLQLYDLLRAIAVNAGSDKLLMQAQDLLKEAKVRDRPAERVENKLAAFPANAQGTKHNDHSVRKKKPSGFRRRNQRLVAFSQQRLKKSPAGHEATFGKSELPGSWTLPANDLLTMRAVHVVRQRQRPSNRRRHALSKAVV